MNRLGRTLLTATPDAPDFRDKPFIPGLRLLPATFRSYIFENATYKERVLDQKNVPACTGFALAAMIGLLSNHEWNDGEITQAPRGPFSPFMLYEMTRRGQRQALRQRLRVRS